MRLILVEMRNNNCPSTLPCGTPESLAHKKCFPSTTTCTLCCFRKLPIQLSVLPFIPYSICIEVYCVVLYQRPLRSPRWPCQLGFCYLYFTFRSCIVASNCVSHEYPILSSCRRMISIFCFSGCPNMCLLICSMTLQHIHVSDTVL